MKKKGRICGTIGLILSLAIAGGTVVYGTMFHGNTVGKAEKLIGASTGSVFDGWINGTGFDATKTLVDETAAVAAGKAASDATYKSYSLSFSYTQTASVTADETETVVQTYTDGVVYTDASYTYIKYTTRMTDDRAVSVGSVEYALVKESGAVYVRTNPTPYTETTAIRRCWTAASGRSLPFLPICCSRALSPSCRRFSVRYPRRIRYT